MAVRARTPKQLDRDIAEALRVQNVDLRKLYAWKPKVEETIIDIAQGRVSRSNDQPVKVSRLDTPKGAFWVIDGHHRVVEAVLRGERTIRIVVDEMLPRIERTGGAYVSVLSNRVNVANVVKSHA